MKGEDELKTKVMKLGEELLSRQTVVNALVIQIRRLREEKEDKLSAENEGLRVAKQEIIGVPMSLLRPNRSAKRTKNPSEHKEEQYPGIAIYI